MDPSQVIMFLLALLQVIGIALMSWMLKTIIEQGKDLTEIRTVLAQNVLRRIETLEQDHHRLKARIERQTTAHA